MSKKQKRKTRIRRETVCLNTCFLFTQVRSVKEQSCHKQERNTATCSHSEEYFNALVGKVCKWQQGHKTANVQYSAAV
jgi:hypothetical protein